MEVPVCSRILNTKGTNANVLGPGTTVPQSSDQRLGVIKSTAKVPHNSTTLSDGLFWVSHSWMTTSRTLQSAQLLSRLVS